CTRLSRMLVAFCHPSMRRLVDVKRKCKKPLMPLTSAIPSSQKYVRASRRDQSRPSGASCRVALTRWRDAAQFSQMKEWRVLTCPPFSLFLTRPAFSWMDGLTNLDPRRAPSPMMEPELQKLNALIETYNKLLAKPPAVDLPKDG